MAKKPEVKAPIKKTNTPAVATPKKKAAIANVNSSLSPKEKKKMARKSINYFPIIIIGTNGEKLLTYSTLGQENEVKEMASYTDCFNHIAWNPNKARGTASKDSGFFKRFGALGSMVVKKEEDKSEDSAVA